MDARSLNAAALTDSLNAFGSASAPTAGSNICTLGIIPAGTYRVRVVVANLGTAETTAANLINIEIVNGATVVQQLPTCATPTEFVIERLTMSGTSSLKLSAKNNAIAGSIYVGSITAQLLS